MKTLYVSEDGKQFSDKKDCIAYEEKRAEEEANKLKKEQEREARRKEVEDARKNYKDLLNKFVDDYGSYSETTSEADYPFITSLFKDFYF